MKAYFKKYRGSLTLATLSVTIFLPLAILFGLAVAVAIYCGIAVGFGTYKMTDDLRQLSDGSIDVSETD